MHITHDDIFSNSIYHRASDFSMMKEQVWLRNTKPHHHPTVDNDVNIYHSFASVSMIVSEHISTTQRTTFNITMKKVGETCRVVDVTTSRLPAAAGLYQ